jgi:hypothetical protein
VIFNPRSHRNRTLRDAAEALPNVIVASPAKRGELGAVLAGFVEKGVECIAISGGDGTVRDVLTAGMPVFGDRWPLLAFAVLVAVMVVVKHRGNIARLRAGTEPRMVRREKATAA